MESSVSLTGYDFVVLGIALLFIVRGIWLGLLRQVVGLLSIVVAYYVASRYNGSLLPFLEDFSNNPRVVFAASVVILFVITYLVSLLVGKGLSKVIEIVISKWFDKVLGGLLGAAMGAVTLVLLHMILGSILPPENAMLKDCTTCEPLDRATQYARSLIRDEEVRRSLSQQSPAISSEELLRLFERQGAGEREAALKSKSPSPVVE